MKKTFFRGLSLPMWSYGGINACVFASYKFMQRIIDPQGNSVITSAAAGAFAGLIQLIPGTPVDLIKIQMQNDALKIGAFPKKGPLMYIREIIRQEGIRGLYKGVGIHALRDVPAFLIYFYSYELCNNLASKHNWGSATSRAFTSGAIAGGLSWVLLIPQDVMKTRIQAGIDKNIMESFRGLRKIGRESFFRGGTMLTIRALLVNAITFAVYEDCSKRLQKIN